MNRAKIEKEILNFISMLDDSGYNTNKYKEIFKNMSDKQFNEYMNKIKNNEARLVFFAPLNKEPKFTINKLIDVAKKLNIPLFEKIIYTNNNKLPDYMTPIEYLIVDLPYKRQSQNLIKKVSIPEHNKSIDQLTFQPTGDSKGAKISYPELQILVGCGLEKSLDELIRFRGGDRNGFNAYNAMIMRSGSASLKTLNYYSSGVESTKTLKAYLTAMHISNTL